MYNTLKTLCLTSSVSGREEAIRAKLTEMIAPFTDECHTDNMGNLIALRRGEGENKKKIMLCAHMDEIGFIVTHIEDNGYIRFGTIGGINLVASAYGPLVSERGVKGMLIPEGGVKAADYTADKFIIDIGAKNRRDAERRVKIGDFFVAAPSLSKLSGSRVCGRPIDDRIGCAIMIKLARALANRPSKHDIYYVFSVQEEVGCRGSRTAAFAIAPDYALVYDVTGAGDMFGEKSMETALGKGAAIKLKDNSVICNTEVVELLRAAAKEKNIPHQTEILLYGGTDTSSIQMSGCGCRAGALSVPTRYTHSSVETIDLADAEACVSLTEAFIEAL